MVNYHKIGINHTKQNCKIITKLVSKLWLNKIAKYHAIGIKNQTNHNCKISQDWHQCSN